VKRGEIWWASLVEPIGSGPGGRRPALIVQSDTFNLSRINTIVIVVITSNVKLSKAPGNVLLSKKISGLPRDSVINVSQILTVDKSLLTELVGELPESVIRQVDDGVRLVLSL
jgi:mRNA interferase MazF